MLGHVRRTTRADVGMSIAFVGVAYLVWALTMGVIRLSANKLPSDFGSFDAPFIGVSFRSSAIHGALIWDVCGVTWLLISLVLVVGASRQRWSVSWAWFSALLQTMACTLLGLWGVQGLTALRSGAATQVVRSTAQVSWTSFSIAFAVALLLWATMLVWLLMEHARLRRGPSLRDGLRTHVGN